MSASALLALLASCLMWGTTGVVASFMTPDVSTFAIGSFTMGVGGLILATITWRDVRRAWRIPAARRWILFGGLGVLVYPLAFYTGMDLIGVAVGNSIALGSGPLFAGLIEWVATRVVPAVRWFIALAVATVGLVFVAVARGGDGGGSLAGIGFGVLAGVAYALYSVSGSRTIATGANFRGAMGAVFGAGAVPLLVVLVFTGGPLVGDLSNLARGAYLALGPLVVAYLFFGYALTKVSAATATLITLLEPAFSVILAVIILGETLPAIGWWGTGLLIAGVVIATVKVEPAKSAD
ncbi:MAG: DMT family transporter [Microbacteriaceae bacterium]